jgi:hypothetical protein
MAALLQNSYVLRLANPLAVLNVNAVHVGWTDVVVRPGTLMVVENTGALHRLG